MLTIGERIAKTKKEGEKIDLWPSGKEGVEARWIVSNEITKTLQVLIYGTDSIFDWILHFLPGWGKRAEIIYGVRLADKLEKIIKSNPGNKGIEIKMVHIYGHSWGGAIAPIVEEILQKQFKDVYVYAFGLGEKKPAVVRFFISYRHKGDIVPFLTPWRIGGF